MNLFALIALLIWNGTGMEMIENENTDLGVIDYENASQTLRDASIPVVRTPDFENEL